MAGNHRSHTAIWMRGARVHWPSVGCQAAYRRRRPTDWEGNIPRRPASLSEYGARIWEAFWTSQSSHYVDAQGPAFEGIVMCAGGRQAAAAVARVRSDPDRRSTMDIRLAPTTNCIPSRVMFSVVDPANVATAAGAT